MNIHGGRFAMLKKGIMMLHQAVTPGAEFEFVNIAHWRSAEDFAAATQSPGFREVAADLARYPRHPALYRTVRN